MSLFIASLAFEKSASAEALIVDRIGILAGSLLSASLGIFLLITATRRTRRRDREDAGVNTENMPT